MGLDLVVEGCARPGHEAEWRRTVESVFAGGIPSDADVARFGEISISGYERLGAPRVGRDKAADDWIIETRKAVTPEQIAEVLQDFDGYYALRLVTSDGLPAYSHGGLYDGVDETSFRGAVLTECGDVLTKSLIDQAWEHKMPESALAYGQALLAAAQVKAAEGPGPPRAVPKPGFLARLGFAKPAPEAIAFEEQLEIVESCGRWFNFWGERGHPIRAWS